MCGRYASSKALADLVDEIDIDASWVTESLAPSYNVAPTDPVYAVVQRPRSERHDEQRQLRVVSWGLVPSWAKDPKIGSRMINARRETVAEKPAFRKAFEKRRCILPADGYFEWYVMDNGKKQPYFIEPADGGTLAMAGLYEIWRDPSKADDAEDRFRWTCTIITTEATDDLGRIHDRMPLMVPRDNWDAWLDPSRAGSLDLMTPAMPGVLAAFPVSTRVGNVANNDPSLVEPIPVEA